MTMNLAMITRKKTSSNKDHGSNSKNNHMQQAAAPFFGCSCNSIAEASCQTGVMFGVTQHWQELFSIENSDIRGNSITVHSCGCSKQWKAVAMLFQ